LALTLILAAVLLAGGGSASRPRPPISGAKARKMTSLIKAAKALEHGALTAVIDHRDMTARADIKQSKNDLHDAYEQIDGADTAGALQAMKAAYNDDLIAESEVGNEQDKSERMLRAAILAKNQAIEDLSSFLHQSAYTLNAPVALSASTPGTTANPEGLVNFCMGVDTVPPQPHESVTLTFTDPSGHTTTHAGTLDSSGKWHITITVPGSGQVNYKLTAPGQQYPTEGNLVLGQPLSEPGAPACPTP
jgi:hypothetical protein